MKLTTAVAAALIATPALAGDLNPPAGAVSPTMKTLDEVEPRTPVESLPGAAFAMHVISEPGSYYLTGNIKSSGMIPIFIAADDVSLDLMGFTIDCDNVAQHAIAIDAGFVHTTIVNGHVRNTTSIAINGEESDRTIVRNMRVTNAGSDAIFVDDESTITDCWIVNADAGVYADGNCQVERVHVQNTAGTGIRVGRASTVSDCSVRNASAGVGIVAGDVCQITNCIVEFIGGQGILGGDQNTVIGCNVRSADGDGIDMGNRAIVRDCSVYLTTANGVSVGEHSLIENCISEDNDFHGFFMSNYTTIRGCTARNNGRFGIWANSVCRVLNNTCYDNSNAGIFGGIKLPASLSVADGNQVWDSVIGIDVDFASNTIVRNVCYSNANANYDIAAGNRAGALSGNPATAGPWDNISY